MPNPPVVHITEHGQVAGEANMMAEIYARGPIAATIAVTAAFEAYHGGIFNDTTGDVVSVARAISTAFPSTHSYLIGP